MRLFWRKPKPVEPLRLPMTAVECLFYAASHDAMQVTKDTQTGGLFVVLTGLSREQLNDLHDRAVAAMRQRARG